MRIGSDHWMSRMRGVAGRRDASALKGLGGAEVQIPERLLSRTTVQATAMPARHAVQGTLAADGSVTVMCSGVVASPLSPWALSHALTARYLADNTGGALGNEALALSDDRHLSGAHAIGAALGHAGHMTQQCPLRVPRME